MESWIKGMGVSTLLEVEECGGRFADHGVPGDALKILKDYGTNLIRLQLWNDPYTDAGEPYGAGTCDLPRTMVLARRAKALGIDWMLDIQYSDFWTDPGKQLPPSLRRIISSTSSCRTASGWAWPPTPARWKTSPTR